MMHTPALRFALTVLAVAALAFYATRATAQVPPGETMVKVSEAFGGFTICVTRPTSWIRADLPEAEMGQVIAHERAHVEHMQEFASCEAYWRWKNESINNAAHAEARAYCAGAMHDFRNGRFLTLEQSVWYQARFMGWAFGWLREMAADAIRYYCMSPP